MLGLFLQPNAAQLIDEMPIDPAVKQHALEVIDKGYTVIKSGISPQVCREAIEAFRRFEKANDTIFAAHRNAAGHYPRIGNLHAAIPELLRLFTRNHMWLTVQDLLLGAPTALYTSLFYEVGSEQPLHRDTPVFTTRPEYLYFGTTVYLEAAGDENGCLEVMEGAHKLEELDREAIAQRRYDSLDKLPQLDNDLWNDYQNAVIAQGRARGLPVKRLYAEAGDSLIWHPQLPHGGTPIKDRSRTRFSLVMHNTPGAMPVYHQQAFFNPTKPFPDKPQWGYREVEGRQIADHRYGISFFGDINYTFDQLRQAPPIIRHAWRPPQRQTVSR
jgi:ectoine hydroxylase-related dioxygenase (phytanoyl-CoA dioxygenase family)